MGKLDKYSSVKFCQKCGGNTKVYDTRLKNNMVIRYRQCCKCFNRFKTIEVIIDQLIGLQLEE